MDLTVLERYSQIRKSAISSAELTSLASFSQIRRSEISLTIFYRIFAIFVTACISGHISRPSPLLSRFIYFKIGRQMQIRIVSEL